MKSIKYIRDALLANFILNRCVIILCSLSDLLAYTQVMET